MQMYKKKTKKKQLMTMNSLSPLMLRAGTAEVTDWTEQQTGARFRHGILELDAETDQNRKQNGQSPPQHLETS